MSKYMGASKHMGGVEMPPNIWGCQLNAPKCRTYLPLKKIRVFEHMGMLGHQGSVQMHGGIQTHGCVQMPQTYGGVKSMPPMCKSYMPLKKIRGV